MRRALPILGLALAAVIVLAVVGVREERTRAFSLPVGPAAPVAKLFAGDTACQRPVVAQEDFEVVLVEVASAGPARLTVEAARPGRRGRPFAAVEVPSPGARTLTRVDLGRTIPQETRFELCVTNRRGGATAVYGARARTEDLSEVAGDGAEENSDMALTFLRDESFSVLSEVPEMFERAALFRPGLIGAWTFWLLFLAVVIGVPALLAAALRETIDS